VRELRVGYPVELFHTFDIYLRAKSGVNPCDGLKDVEKNKKWRIK
jgi:hypothetical protein